jgi:NADH dehydrogenase FAD-containing subunit
MHNIVVLGVGFAGAPIIRQTMRNVVLPGDDFKLTVVTPNTHFHFASAMPRAFVPGQIPEHKVVLELAPYFREYGPDKFEFVVGGASKLDPDAKVVDVTLADGSTRSLSYDTLVVATGTISSDGLPWKSLETTEKTKAYLAKLHQEITDAKTIVVAGGGHSGTEAVGELGYEYSRVGAKEVIFVHSGALPLDGHIPSVRQAARNELEKLKVKFIANAKVVSSTKDNGDYVIELQTADGTKQTVRAQSYVPALGMTPNTSFAPASMLDERGYMKQDAQLRAVGYEDIFVAGDVGDMEAASLMVTQTQVLHTLKSLMARFKGEPEPEAYKPDPTVTAGITLGRSKGTGQAGNWKLPSILIWWFKGRYMGTNVSEDTPWGKKLATAVLEK